MTGVALVYVDVDVRAKFGNSRLNSGRIIRLFVCPDPFYALLCSFYLHFRVDREKTSDVISGRFVRPTVPDNPVKFRDPRLNRCREFHPKPSAAAFSAVLSR